MSHMRERLAKNELGLPEIVASTLANIAPAVSFYFGFGVIVAGAGVAAPLTIVLAMVAILFLGNTLAEFSKLHPSTGSFVTFIGLGFGPAAGAAAAVFTIIGYCVGAAAIVVEAGGWAHDTLKLYAGLNIPWQILAAASVAICGALAVQGVKISTLWASIFFYFEAGLLAVASAAMLIVNRHTLTLAPFSPANLSGGLAGMGLGFPLAVYFFVGWENSATLAEETRQPRRSIPRALFLATLAIGLVYIFMAYSVEIAFHTNAHALAAAPVPFVDAIRLAAPALLILAYIAGITSIFSCLLGLTNSQARILFSSGRENLLPALFGRLHKQHRTPHIAIWVYISSALLIALAFGWTLDPVITFGYTATLGTIPVIFVYMIANVALPVYVLRHHRAAFHPIRHAALPMIAVLITLLPIWGLVQPGQPYPFNIFPALTLALLILALLYGLLISRRPLSIGSYIADDPN
jgi:amino acid transporter